MVQKVLIATARHETLGWYGKASLKSHNVTFVFKMLHISYASVFHIAGLVYASIFWNGHMHIDLVPLIKEKGRQSVNPFMHNVDEWSNILWKSGCVNTIGFLKNICPFF